MMITIFFVCATIGSATEVAHSIDTLGYNSPLPNDCNWLHHVEMHSKEATYMLPVDAVMVNDQWYWIAKVRTHSNHSGYSAGYPLTS
jgi:hypothetical protein